MNNNATQKIKKYLEETYDIPFDIKGGMFYNDAWFKIKPQNHEQELFDINVRFKNKLRLVIEVTPEKYAAFSIKDMGEASMEKKEIFAEYARQLNTRKAKIEFYVNDVVRNPTYPDAWPQEWDNYRLRISRSPICGEDEEYDVTEITIGWTTVVTGMLLSLLNVIQIDEIEKMEGGLKKTIVNRYERNPINRELCIAVNGYTCKICGFNFKKAYGTIGHHFIHVHHIVPVSKMDSTYIIKPVKDLIPVCPNCHAMLHRNDPPLIPDELKGLISTKRK
jgi:5-methylcytosine-specific restriction protein A